MAEASYRDRIYHCSRNNFYRSRNNSLARLNADREICRYFLEGRCRFDNSCWNSHNPRPNYPPSIRSQQNNKSSTRPLYLQNESQHSMYPSSSPRQPGNRSNDTNYRDPSPEKVVIEELCVDFMNGKCTARGTCRYVHGDLCELCLKACLNPFNPEQQEKHTKECQRELDRDPPHVQLSKDKSCGICMDIIFEKEAAQERRFGILENCNHVFCFTCIMKWRKVKSQALDIDNVVDPTVANSCPECRIQSDFITPSRYWFTTIEEKQKLVADRRAMLKKKHCHFYKRGKGFCPYGGSCYYLHALPNGHKVDLPVLSGQRARNNRSAVLGQSLMSRLLLLDFLDPDDHFMLENLMLMSSGSEFDEEDQEDDDLSYISDGYFTIGSFEI